MSQAAPETGLRLDDGRFTVVADPVDTRLARTLLNAALANDTFPGLPRPRQHVLIAVAPNASTFRRWVGPEAPEWGAAIAFPDRQRIIMQGGRAASDAGDPIVVLRHELAHLALHEALGALPPRWFDEGYASVAAGEWSREQTFETSLSLVWRTMPDVDGLDAGFRGAEGEAGWSYAMAYRAVSELGSLDPAHGFTNFFRYWRETRSFERGLRAAYGITSDQFDLRWHAATRRRYGALSLVSNLSVAFGVFGLALAPAYLGKRRRNKARIAAMRAREARQEAAARQSALTALMATTAVAPESALAHDGMPPPDFPP